MKKAFLSKAMFAGAAGQFALMSELTLRGYNVAVSEIDIGEDLFVINEMTKERRTVQVKTSVTQYPQTRKGCWLHQFHINERAIVGKNPVDQFAFVMRIGPKWRYVILTPEFLFKAISDSPSFGYAYVDNQKKLKKRKLHFQFYETENRLECGGLDLTEYLDGQLSCWKAFPSLFKPDEVEQEGGLTFPLVTKLCLVTPLGAKLCFAGGGVCGLA